MQLDSTDRALLRQLQRDSARSMQTLAEAVGLSASSCHRRVKALEAEGLITGYRAELNAEKLGYAMLFFIEITILELPASQP